MFTEHNTEGFSQAQLQELNAALEQLVGEGWDEQSASDTLNNVWTETHWTAGELVSAARK